jgi:hypothetical protein
MRLVRSKTHGAKFQCPAHDYSLTVRDVVTRYDIDSSQLMGEKGTVWSRALLNDPAEC